MQQMPNKETATIHDYAAMPRGFGFGTCAICGTALIYNYMIVSADGNRFVVGCECVNKRGDKRLKAEVRKFRLDAAAAKRTAEKAAATRARHEAERAANGGLTNAELYKKQREEERAAGALALEATHGELFAKLRADRNPLSLDIIANALHWGNISEKQLALLNKISAEIDRRAAMINDYFGEVGKRYTQRLTVASVFCIYHAQYFGDVDRYIVIAHNEAGNTFKYLGSTPESLPAKGETADVTFTVKDHSDYYDQRRDETTKQTRIARPKTK
jgi:hypothetical protein